MTTPRLPKSVTDAVSTAISNDLEIQTRARALAETAFDEAERIFREGHPSAKEALLGRLLPTMMKPDKDGEEDEERVALRAELATLYKEAGLTE